jgi:hypothetical protein
MWAVLAALARHQAFLAHQSLMLAVAVQVLLVAELLVLVALVVVRQVAQVVVAQAAKAHQTSAAEVVAAEAVRQVFPAAMAVLAAQASSSFPMLAHNNLVAVSSLQVVVTPFTHLQLLALLFQLHLCLHPIWLLQVAVAVDVQKTQPAVMAGVVVEQVAIAQAQQQLTQPQLILSRLVLVALAQLLLPQKALTALILPF